MCVWLGVGCLGLSLACSAPGSHTLLTHTHSLIHSFTPTLTHYTHHNTDQKIESVRDIVPLLEQVTRLNSPLMIVAEDVTGGCWCLGGGGAVISDCVFGGLQIVVSALCLHQCCMALMSHTCTGFTTGLHLVPLTPTHAHA